MCPEFLGWSAWDGMWERGSSPLRLAAEDEGNNTAPGSDCVTRQHDQQSGWFNLTERLKLRVLGGIPNSGFETTHQ